MSAMMTNNLPIPVRLTLSLSLSSSLPSISPVSHSFLVFIIGYSHVSCSTRDLKKKRKRNHLVDLISNNDAFELFFHWKEFLRFKLVLFDFNPFDQQTHGVLYFPSLFYYIERNRKATNKRTKWSFIVLCVPLTDAEEKIHETNYRPNDTPKRSSGDDDATTDSSTSSFRRTRHEMHVVHEDEKLSRRRKRRVSTLDENSPRRECK